MAAIEMVRKKYNRLISEHGGILLSIPEKITA